MSKYTEDPRTVAFDWQEHLKLCTECCTQKNAEHYERVKFLAEKYPLSCTACGKALEESAQHCYHVNEATGIMCRGTQLYFRAHQSKLA